MRAVLLRHLLASPDLRALTLLAGDPAHPVTAVRVVDQLADLRALPREALAIVLPKASAQARGHLFDIALRNATAAGAAGVVLTSTSPGSIEPSALHIASRSTLALLVAPPPTEPTRLIVAASRALTGDASDALTQIDTACRLLPAAEATHPSTPDAILAAAATALGSEVQVDQPPGAEPAAPVRLDGATECVLTVPELDHTEQSWTVAAHTVLRLTADAYARVLAAQRRTTLAPLRDRGRLLGELIFAPDSERVSLIARARALGLPIDGWHQVLRFELSSSLHEPTHTVGADQLDAATTAALDAIRADGDDRWYSTRIGSDPLLVHSLTNDPGPSAARTAHRAATTASTTTREQFPGLRTRCGIGAVHRGAEGLRTSATDARAALAISRQTRPPRDIVAIDALGMNRMLIAWHASGATRQTVDDLLAPLAALGTTTAEDHIRTLQAYLDHQNSPGKAAHTLRIHPQTVNYRIRKIKELLSADLGDPEQRLALQLACRAWLLR